MGIQVTIKNCVAGVFKFVFLLCSVQFNVHTLYMFTYMYVRMTMYYHAHKSIGKYNRDLSFCLVHFVVNTV